MSGSANNLPARVSIEGVEDVSRQLRALAQEYATTSRAAENMAPSFNRGVDALSRLEQRTSRAGIAVQDLRGALELLGASGVAGGLGQVAGTLGNVGDALSTAGLAAGRFGGALAALLPFWAPLAAGAAALAGGIALINDNMRRQEERAEAARQAQRLYSDAIRTSNEFLGRYVETAEQAWNAKRREEEQTLRNALALERETAARINEAHSRAAATRMRLEDAVASGRAAPGQVAGGLARARAAEANLVAFQEASTIRLGTIQRNLDDVTSRTFEQSRGGSAGRPAGGTTGRAGGVAREPGMVGDQMVAQFWREQERQDQARQQQIDAEQRRIDQFEQRSVAAFSRIGEAAIDRIGGALVQSFIRGEGAAVNFRGVLTGALASAGSDIVGMGVVNPALNAVLGGSRPTLGAALGGGGFGDLGGLASGLGGFFNTPLWTTAPTLGAPMMGANGMLTGGGATSLAGVAGPTLGSALGAFGGGFAAGSTIGGFVAGDSPARQTNAMIGAGVGSAGGTAAAAMIGGAAAGPVGLLIGALLGGAIGGAGGGLIGPGPPNEGFNVQIQANGGFGISDAQEAGRGAQLVQSVLQTEQEIAAANALLSRLGVRAGGGSAFGEDPQNARIPRNFAGTISDFSFRADNANLDRALQGRSVSSLGELEGIANFVTNVYEALQRVDEPADAFARQIDAINAQFDAIVEQARELNLAEAGLQEARARALTQVQAAREAEAAAARQAEEAARNAERQRAAGAALPGVTSLTDFVRGLRTANDNPLNPVARLQAAQADFSRLTSGNGASLDRVRGSAEAVLSGLRDVFGTGRGFAEGTQSVLDQLERFSTQGADVLTAQAQADIQRSATEILQAELVALRGEVVRLRTEVQQGGANPLAGRAA